jgi:serine/threonine protein kinase
MNIEEKPQLSTQQRELVARIVEGAVRRPAAERTAYIAELAASDDRVRLLAQSIINRDAADTADLPPTPEPAADTAHLGRDGPGPSCHRLQAGDVIDAYTLIEAVGKGGFGEVWMAEQREPVRQRVAIKIIKPEGRDAAQILTRFAAERQALAIMDHPGIAKVLGGGALPNDGRPYFVMEYIAGEPITRHCDKNRLTLDERLELFTQVCDAVDHAHERGVIHRDIKPSNILVAYQASRPVVKIIDFGVAKALSQPLTDRPFHTMIGQAIGTPEYMSPEQAEMDRQSIDQRSDVYSLGVLLYELLCGMLPFESSDLRGHGPRHMRETLRSAQPLSPSDRLSALEESEGALGSRLSGLGQSAKPTAEKGHAEARTGRIDRIAERRSLASRRLIKALRGELDAITMKCLSKRREHRYERASDLARDLRRYLEGQTIAPQDTDPEPGGSRRRVAIIAGGAAVALAAVAIGILLGWPSDERRSDPTGGAGEMSAPLVRESRGETVPPQLGKPVPPTVDISPEDLAQQVRRLVPLETVAIEATGPTEPVILRGWVVNEQELDRIAMRVQHLGSNVLQEVKADAAEVRRRLHRALDEAGAQRLRVVERGRPDWGPPYLQMWFLPTGDFDLEAARGLGRRFVLDDSNLMITPLPE